MAEKDYLLTQSQELLVTQLMGQDALIALMGDSSLGHEQLNFSEEYNGLYKEENDSHSLQQGQIDAQLLPQHVSQLMPQDVSQLYQPQTPNNYANQSNNYNSQLIPFHSSDHLPLPVNYPPINRSFQQINQVKMPPIISTEDYAGPHNFDVYFDPLAARNPWLYSSTLEKLFITMGDCFPVDFKRNCEVKDLFVRATTLYVSPQLNQEIVVRCNFHTNDLQHNLDVPEPVKNHVLRCQDSNSNYQGEVKKKQHLSVVVPLGLPQPGTDVVRLIYYFVCKNSCPAGINRRPTCTIFTLEDKFGNVMGRRRVNVRVCSCPKRDKEKEEKDAQSGPVPRGKKRKLGKVEKREVIDESTPATDNKEQQLNLRIYGRETKLLVLNAAYDRLSGEINRYGTNENLRKSLIEIEEQIKKCEE